MQKISKTQKRIKLEWKRELKNFFNTCLRIIMMDAGLPKVWSVIVNKRKDLDYNLQVFKNLLFKELWFKTNRRSPPEPVNKTKEWICLVKKKEQKARNAFCEDVNIRAAADTTKTSLFECSLKFIWPCFLLCWISVQNYRKEEKIVKCLRKGVCYCGAFTTG